VKGRIQRVIKGVGWGGGTKLPVATPSRLTKHPSGLGHDIGRCAIEDNLQPELQRPYQFTTQLGWGWGAVQRYLCADVNKC